MALNRFVQLISVIDKLNLNMSQFRPPAHRCQIDCTNHDEVINALELKSKDLYYFWRNYEWLYNRYYSEQQSNKEREAQPEPTPRPEPIKIKENHDKCEQQIDELEKDNERLARENKKLRSELEICRKQLSEHENSNRFEQDYKKELNLLRNKCSEFESLNEKLMGEVNKLKKSMREAEDEHDQQRSRWTRENKKNMQINVELQQTIDELRSKPQPVVPAHPAPSKSEGPSAYEIEEMSRKQTTIVSTRMKSLSEEASRVVSEQCETLRRQLEERLEDILSGLTQRELQTLIVSIESQ